MVKQIEVSNGRSGSLQWSLLWSALFSTTISIVVAPIPMTITVISVVLRLKRLFLASYSIFVYDIQHLRVLPVDLRCIQRLQGASAGHQLCFVELKLRICVSNSGGSATYNNNECCDIYSMYIMYQNKIRSAMWQEKKEDVKLYVFRCCQPTPLLLTLISNFNSTKHS